MKPGKLENTVRAKPHTASGLTLRRDRAKAKARAKRADRNQAVSQYLTYYRTTTDNLLLLIRQGIPVREIEKAARAMQVTNEDLYELLHLPPSTMKRKLKNNDVLTPEQSERLLELMKLIGKVEDMLLSTGGDPDIESGVLLAHWLTTPLPALKGERPAEYMDTVAGAQRLSQLLSMIVSGAYA
ncbi:hypothetical protein BI364_07495 [Acidihalobacter yilgarnensis]|uniref:Uncharacterized protein n=1 Tax=Acidihalobacter yilgarnensis TaxID=2819280 RepID=A0A1D8IMY1_9GAMM|nr:antitoxin Xre-like helix-turn-helix domain-containing protein [Acidihalobacter yilgarnensis]AOU97829.1 hypothetical protein BI364_07495 [Acidihalobacter yilgarnensis]